jgi:hypothetical protein
MFLQKIRALWDAGNTVPRMKPQKVAKKSWNRRNLLGICCVSVWIEVRVHRVRGEWRHCPPGLALPNSATAFSRPTGEFRHGNVPTAYAF